MIKRIFWSGTVFCLMLAVIAAPQISRANDLTECMTTMMQQVDDSMTIAELRLQCEKQLHEGTYVVQDKESSVVSERIRDDKEHVLQPFTLMSHKPNYILMGAYNTVSYDPAVYRDQFDDPSIDLDDTEAQFQVSVKVPLAVNLFDMMDIYAAYTNHSFWQLYDSDSSPFRETNHEPEAWVQFEPNWTFLGLTNTVNAVGFVHQSNGRGGSLSRSWNRIYANLAIEKGPLALSFKPWYRIPENDDDDDNPDITDYLGHYELRAAYKWGDHVFSAMSRNNLESGFSRGAVELTWSFPLGSYPFLKGYIQYFNGYGESLIDYDNHVNKIGIGFALTDWL